MPNGTSAQLLFPSFDRRNIEASFEGGNVSSDGGLLLLRQLEERLGLIPDFSRVLPDDRHPSLISHSQKELLAQRIFGLAQGYEDLNDHDTLRHDLLWQSAVHRDTPLGSSPTLCRLEKRAARQSADLSAQTALPRCRKNGWGLGHSALDPRWSLPEHPKTPSNPPPSTHNDQTASHNWKTEKR